MVMAGVTLSFSSTLPLNQFHCTLNVHGRGWYDNNCNNKRRVVLAATSSTNASQVNGTKVSAMATAASLALLLSPCPAQAGLLSGMKGIESIPGPEIPPIDLFTRIQDKSRSTSEANDARFKSSPLLQELLKRSQANAQKNKQEIEDKYCERGAEWGVGNCSTVGMTEQEREAFMEMLRKKRAPN